MAAEIARFQTRSGHRENNDLKFTRAIPSITGYRLQCTACHLAGTDGPFRIQDDALAAARTHANRCLA